MVWFHDLPETMCLTMSIPTLTYSATRRLIDISPREFENLTFDLLTLMGLQRLVWRTPGADGGRDIEGIFSYSDLSGYRSEQIWYVECKRYTASIDWPTVRQKVSYAENHQADFLLLVSTENVSPTCRNEITAWNDHKKVPSIRVWAGHDLDHILSRFPSVLLKYGLQKFGDRILSANSPVIMEQMKITQGAYSAFYLGVDVVKPLEAAAALSELVTRNIFTYEKDGKFVYNLENISLGKQYDWLDVDGDVSILVDEISFRAIVSLLRYVSNCGKIKILRSESGFLLVPDRGFDHSSSMMGLLSEVAVWAGYQ